MFSSLRDTFSLAEGGNVTVGALTQGKVRPTHMGYLVKEGAVVKSWKKRFCILHGTHLHYFKNNRKDTAASGRVELRGATVRTAGKITGKLNSFAIQAADRTYYFVADSDKERQDWMLALHAATGVSLSKSEGEQRFGGGSLREESREGLHETSRDSNYTFVMQASRWLISTRGVWAKSLFCEAGFSHEVAAIRRQVASGGEVDISQMSPHSVAMALKMSLRDMGPLIPHSLFLRYVAVAEGHKSESTRRRELKALLGDSASQQMLQLVVNLLQETSDRAPDEGTPASHLAVIFAPLIAPTPDLPNYFPQLAQNALLLITKEEEA